VYPYGTCTQKASCRLGFYEILRPKPRGNSILLQRLVDQLGKIFDDRDGEAGHVLQHDQALQLFGRIDPPFRVGGSAPAEFTGRTRPVG